ESGDQIQEEIQQPVVPESEPGPLSLSSGVALSNLDSVIVDQQEEGIELEVITSEAGGGELPGALEGGGGGATGGGVGVAVLTVRPVLPSGGTRPAAEGSPAYARWEEIQRRYRDFDLAQGPFQAQQARVAGSVRQIRLSVGSPLSRSGLRLRKELDRVEK